MKEKPKVKIIHVFPADTIEEHEKTENCKCKPNVEEFGSAGKVFFHNSFDGTKYFDMDREENRWRNIGFLSTGD